MCVPKSGDLATWRFSVALTVNTSNWEEKDGSFTRQDWRLWQEKRVKFGRKSARRCGRRLTDWDFFPELGLVCLARLLWFRTHSVCSVILVRDIPPLSQMESCSVCVLWYNRLKMIRDEELLSKSLLVFTIAIGCALVVLGWDKLSTTAYSSGGYYRSHEYDIDSLFHSRFAQVLLTLLALAVSPFN